MRPNNPKTRRGALRAPKQPKNRSKSPKNGRDDYCRWDNYCRWANAVRPYKIDPPLGGKERKREKIGNEGKKGKKREKGLQGPPGTAHHPKTVVVEVVAAVVVAASGTAEIWIEEPRTAPQYTVSFICQEFFCAN